MGFPSSQFRETQFCPPEKDRRTYSVSLRGKRSQKPQEGSNLQHFEPVLSVHRRLGGACGCYTPGAHESEPFSPEQTPRQLGNSCYRPPPRPPPCSENFLVATGLLKSTPARVQSFLPSNGSEFVRNLQTLNVFTLHSVSPRPQQDLASQSEHCHLAATGTGAVSQYGSPDSYQAGAGQRMAYSSPEIWCNN